MLSTLKQAILRRSPPTRAHLPSLDRGSQYSGNDFKALLVQYEIVGSMSRKGDCWDNAVAQEFFPYT